MKVAVCYSGMFRNFTKTVDNHLEYLINEYKCDTFISLWDVYGNGGVFHKYGYSDTDLITDEDKNLIESKLKPKKMFYEEFNKIEPFFEEQSELLRPNYKELGDFQPYPKNIMSMYYKIKSCGGLLKGVRKKYDVVIKMRTDVMFKSKIILNNPEENTVYTSVVGHWNNETVVDTIYYGDRKTMSNIFLCYDDLFKLWGNISSINAPEHLFYNLLLRKNINIVRDYFDYKIVR